MIVFTASMRACNQFLADHRGTILYIDQVAVTLEV